MATTLKKIKATKHSLHKQVKANEIKFQPARYCKANCRFVCSVQSNLGGVRVSIIGRFPLQEAPNWPRSTFIRVLFTSYRKYLYN